MRIHSFIATELLLQELITLSPRESHHLARVLRVEPGQELTLFDGKGTHANGTIETVGKKEVTVRITARKTVPKSTVEITLVQAICKPDRFEMILQKATELGIQTIQPVTTQNVSLPAGKIEKMIARSEAIIRNAGQQCGTAWLPKLLPLLPLSKISFGASVTLVGSLHPDARPFRETFRTLEKSQLQTAAILIGPEGDFTREEVAAAVASGAVPVSFGNQILRTETAAIFGLSVLAYELF